ncbi:MAG: flagellar hook-length control protein FliK [Azonexus sp.]|jgi:flagellar hook-length control protein FliK|nr:flagellar hook-length control protein FliK [Azonexus sp.]
MSVTVISSAPGLSLPGLPASGATAGDDAGGGFAALLSSELFSQIDLAAALGNPGLVTDSSGDNPISVVTDDKGNSASDDADASLFASLFGPLANTALTPGTIATPAATGNSDGEKLSIDSGSAKETPELLTANSKPAAPKADGLFDKVLGNSGATTVRSPAANIAGDNAATETPGLAASQLAANSAASQAAPQTAGAAQLRVDAPLHTPVWPQQFGDKVVWMAKSDQQTAQLDINPPQLGPVQITVNLNGNQASILFASPHAEVRQAIENAMPQLKEMLSAAGINLGEANVGANPQQSPQREMAFGDADKTRATDETAILPANEKGANTASTAVLQRGRGLVDLFA